MHTARLKVQHWGGSIALHAVAFGLLFAWQWGTHPGQSKRDIELNISLLNVAHGKPRPSVLASSARAVPATPLARLSEAAPGEMAAVRSAVQSGGGGDAPLQTIGSGNAIDRSVVDNALLTQTLWGMMNGRKRYPLIARRMGMEGQVIIEAVIDGQGRLLRADIKQSAGSILDQDALALLKAVTPLRTEHFKFAASTTVLIPVAYALNH